MGMLVEGRWTDEDLWRQSKDGSFVRPSSSFRSAVSRAPGAEFPAAAGRYHLFVAPSCPWAHRTALVRRIKGLDDIVSLSYANLPKLQGWAFSQGLDALQPVDGVLHAHRIYAAAQPGYTGRVTVPVLWDRQRREYETWSALVHLRFAQDTASPSYSPHSRESLVGMVQPSGIA